MGHRSLLVYNGSTGRGVIARASLSRVGAGGAAEETRGGPSHPSMDSRKGNVGRCGAFLLGQRCDPERGWCLLPAASLLGQVCAVEVGECGESLLFGLTG